MTGLIRVRNVIQSRQGSATRWSMACWREACNLTRWNRWLDEARRLKEDVRSTTPTEGTKKIIKAMRRASEELGTCSDIHYRADGRVKSNVSPATKLSAYRVSLVYG